MKICEIFKSIQGESSYSGYPCSFIRLSGCNLRCTWCDTAYSYDDGDELSMGEILRIVDGLETRLVEITGGEPLLQEETYDLVQFLVGKERTVLIETNGSIDIRPYTKTKATLIMDWKCPSSGSSDRMFPDNIKQLRPTDEIKFVIASKEDFEWARGVYLENVEFLPNEVILSPVIDRITPRELAKWVVESGLDLRFQIQLHKYLWPARLRGI